MRRALVVAVVCSCVPDEGECGPIGQSCRDANTIRTCSAWPEMDDTPRDEACGDGRHCVEDLLHDGTPYATCAIGEKETRCRADLQSSSFCDGSRLVKCRGEYRVSESDCPTLEQGLVCAKIERERLDGFGMVALAACVRSPEPDDRCNANDQRSTFCEGERQVECIGAFAGPSKDCAAEGRFCRLVSDFARCTIQPEPDPRCEGRESPDETYCDGDTAVHCFAGWRTDQFDCTRKGQRCHEILAVGSNDPQVACQ